MPTIYPSNSVCHLWNYNSSVTFSELFSMANFYINFWLNCSTLILFSLSSLTSLFCSNIYSAYSLSYINILLWCSIILYNYYIYSIMSSSIIYSLMPCTIYSTLPIKESTYLFATTVMFIFWSLSIIHYGVLFFWFMISNISYNLSMFFILCIASYLLIFLHRTKICPIS
jgi:hypothetical protein